MFLDSTIQKILSFGQSSETDISTMVSTACSSIENQALISPFFFKTFILMIGIFFVIHVFSKEIWNKWFKNENMRNYLINIIIFGTLFLWSILGGGSNETVRSGFSFAFIIHGILIFISTSMLIYYSINFFSKKRK